MKKLSTSSYATGISIRTISRRPLKTSFGEKKLLTPEPPQPPSEEMLTRLNDMAKKYPFCVMYKEKNNDPL